MERKMEVVLGSVYTDKVTGFSGVALSRHQYMNGCVRICIQPRGLREGKMIEAQTFDIEQLAPPLETKRPGKSVIDVNPRATGGPGDIPKPRMIPRR
jgi:hypothetical protein